MRRNASADLNAETRPLRRDAAENRRRLLSAAHEVFTEQGPNACVEDIARAAGIGMGTLYRRFPTKQHLIEELIREQRKKLAEAAQSALEDTDDRCLDRMIIAACEATFASRGLPPRLWSTIAADNEQTELFRRSLRTALARAQAAGVARHELVLADLLAAIWSVRGVIEQIDGTAPDSWRRHIEIVLAGMRPATPLISAPMTPAQLSNVRAAQHSSGSERRHDRSH